MVQHNRNCLCILLCISKFDISRAIVQSAFPSSVPSITQTLFSSSFSPTKTLSPSAGEALASDFPTTFTYKHSDAPSQESTFIPSDPESLYQIEKSDSPTIVPFLPECWNNLTLLFSDLVQQPALAHNTYTLCPNTVFEIGYNQDGLCCSNGDLPLVGRANTHYKCGQDGSSSNNCTLRFGTIQATIDQILFEEETTNVTFEGITFEQASSYVSLPATSGYFTFKDCVFQDNKNEGPFIMLHLPEGKSTTRQRILEEKAAFVGMDPWTKLDYITSPGYLQQVKQITNEAHEALHVQNYNNRMLQSAITKTRQTGYFQGCTFRNNQQGIFEGIATHGILTSFEPSNTMEFDDCIFQDNVYGNPAIQLDGYAIQSLGSPIVILNSCFLNNDFIGVGTVQALNNAQVQYSNVYGTYDSGLQCQFVASHLTTPKDQGEVQCRNYDASACMSVLSSSPSSISLSPSPSPSLQIEMTMKPSLNERTSAAQTLCYSRLLSFGLSTLFLSLLS